MWEFVVDIANIQNGEKWVNRQLEDWVDLRDNRLSKAICDGYVIRFYFEPKSRQDATRRVIAKQFSKKKYASCDEGVKKFFETNSKQEGAFFVHNWREVLRIEQERYWLVIYEEIR